MNDAADDPAQFDIALWDALQLFEQLPDPLVEQVCRRDVPHPPHNWVQALSGSARLQQCEPRGYPELPGNIAARLPEHMCTPQRASEEVDQATIAPRGTVPRLTVPSPPCWQPRPMMLAVQRRLDFEEQHREEEGLDDEELYAAMRRYMGLPVVAKQHAELQAHKRRRTKSGEGARRPLGPIDPNVVGLSHVLRARRGGGK